MEEEFIETTAKELIVRFMEYPNLMDYTEDGYAIKNSIICVDEMIGVLEHHSWQNQDYIELYEKVRIKLLRLYNEG